MQTGEQKQVGIHGGPKKKKKKETKKRKEKKRRRSQLDGADTLCKRQQENDDE